MDKILLTKTQLTHFLPYWGYISTFQIIFFHPFHQKHGHAHQPPDGGSHHHQAPGTPGGTEWGKIGKLPHTPTISYDDSNDSNHESQGWWVGETWIALLWLCQLHCVCSILIILIPEWYKRKLPSLSSDCTNTIVCSVLSCDSSIVDLMTTCMMTLFIYRVQREQLAIYYCIEHALVSSRTLHSALLQLHFPSSSWYSADD